MAVSKPVLLLLTVPDRAIACWEDACKKCVCLPCIASGNYCQDVKLQKGAQYKLSYYYGKPHATQSHGEWAITLLARHAQHC